VIVPHQFDLPYHLELLYERAPVLHADSIVETLRLEMQIDPISGSNSVITLAHPDQVTRCSISAAAPGRLRYGSASRSHNTWAPGIQSGLDCL
jgi:hypothetical protein